MAAGQRGVFDDGRGRVRLALDDVGQRLRAVQRRDLRGRQGVRPGERGGRQGDEAGREGRAEARGLDMSCSGSACDAILQQRTQRSTNTLSAVPDRGSPQKVNSGAPERRIADDPLAAAPARRRALDRRGLVERARDVVVPGPDRRVGAERQPRRRRLLLRALVDRDLAPFGFGRGACGDGRGRAASGSRRARRLRLGRRRERGGENGRAERPSRTTHHPCPPTGPPGTP